MAEIQRDINTKYLRMFSCGYCNGKIEAEHAYSARGLSLLVPIAPWFCSGDCVTAFIEQLIKMTDDDISKKYKEGWWDGIRQFKDKMIKKDFSIEVSPEMQKAFKELEQERKQNG